jgi:receptor-type tyrosine-protein phosphatase Q
MLQARPSGSPQNVRVTQRQLTSITLEWQPPLSYQQNGIITTYTVQITQLGESLSTVTTTGLRITISSLLPNSLYSFMVAASTAVGRGPYTSPSLNVRTLSPAVTSPPQDVTVMVLDHERIHVTWSPPPASEQSGDITSYTVRVTEIDSGQTWENNTNLVTQWTLGNLHPYYTYAVQVKAVPASGSGLYSDAINATTLPSEPSGAPGITYTDTTTHSVLLRWTPLPLNQQNGIISGYVIHYLEDGQEQSVSVPSYVLEYTFEAIPYTEYVLSVAAVNSVGLGPFSATVEVRTPEDNPTHQPRSLMGVALNSTSIHLTWDSPPEEHHNGEIDSYTVLCSEMNSGGSLSRHSTPTTNITITGLHPYFTYHCNVSAVTVGHGPFSTVTSITTLEDAPSGSPTNLTATDTGPDFVSLSWIPPDLAQQNGIIRHYLINAYPINSSAPDVSQSTPSSSISHTLGALQPYTLYSISVAAVTIVTGPSSTPIEVETSEDVPSGSPDTVTLTPLSPYRLSVMWQAPPVETQNGEIRYYVVKVIEEVTMAETLLNTSDDSTVFFLDELHPYYHYIVTVAAASVGIGPFSSQSTVHMPATAPSRPPLEIKGRALTSSSILVQWDPPPVEHQNGEIESYIILCIEHNTGRTLRLDTTPITNVTISELHPFYSYVCNVSAVTVDSGPFSDTINVTTLEDVPSAAPFNLVIEEISSHNISLTWSGPDIQQRNGIIRTYIFYVVPRESSWLNESIHTTQSPEEQYTIIGLHPYTTYDIYVAAVTIAQGPNSTQLFVQTEEEVPSSPPVGLSVIPLTPQDLLVSWQAPPRELQNGLIRSYTIQLLTVATGILTLRNSSSLNVTIKSLHPHYEYEISVAASTVGLGPYSTEITVIMPESEPSGPPTITATKASSDSIYLRWSPPPLEDQNGIITGYVIDSLSNRKNISVSVNLTEHILEAFPYTGYQLRVAALNSIGQGPFSGVVNVETLQDAPSHTPISLRGVVFNSSSIELEWEPPPPQHQNGEIVSYTLLCSEIDSDGMVTKHISTTTTITITGLHPYYTYNCSVAAVTVGQGPFSDPVSITTLEDAPSGRPHNITVLNVTSNSIYLSWTAPDPSQQNGVIWRYLIYLTANDYSITYSTSTSSTTYNLTDLNPYTSYQVKVAAVTISPGPNSTAETIKTGETVPTVPPQDVLVNPISSHNLSVTWRAPRRENRNGEIRHYNVTVLEVATGNQSWYITPDSSAHFTITVLHPYYSYHIYVAAITIGLGPFTPKVTVRMPQAAPSSPPLNVSLVEKGSNYILLQWLPPIDMYRNGIIRHYFIILKESNGSGVFNHTTPTSQPSGNVGSLQPDTEYTCSVAAVTVSTGPLSPAITFTTEPDVPGTVQSLMAVAVSSRSMIISWQPPIEEQRNGQIIEYNVNITLYKGTGESYMTTSVSTSVVVNSLHPNYVYQCFVASRTSAGLGPLNQVVLKLPPDAPTGHPRDIKAVASDSNTLHIYWSPPVLDQQNGDITQYGINITDVESGIVSQYNTSGPITSHIVFELLSYNVYQYTVTAFTVIGHGPYSPVYTVRMPSAAPTSPPLNLSLDELGSTYALLRWSPPPQNERNGAIQNYQISLNSSVGSNLNLTTAGSQLYILLDFLVPNTGYTCTVAAVTVSPGPTSAPLQFTTSISVPETVQSLRGIVLSPRSLNLSWQPPLLMSGPNLNYRINITPLNGHSGFRTILTNSTSVVIDMLHPASFYLCLVTSRSGTGLWQPTSILLELPPDVPSGYPRNVFAVASDSKTLYITWSPPLREDQNGNILHYGINITDLQSGEVTQFTTSDSVTSIVIQHLHPHYYYNYTITAFTSVGNGPYSPSNSIQMPQDVPDAPPINLTVTNVAPGIVSLHWFSPPLENQNGHIIGYIVRIIDLDPVKIVDIEIDTTTTKTNKGGLKTTHPYNFSVAAITEQGWGPFSHPISIVTLHGVPSAPTGVIAGRVTATQMNVSWSLLEKPFEPILYYTVKYYPLNRNLQSRTAVEYTDQMVNTTKNLTIDDLYPTFAYNVSVAANTAAGTGNFSEDIFVGLSENSLFQLFFNGAIDCQEWILHHIDTKLQSTKIALSHELEKSCQCHFSWDYVLFNQPHCISAHTNWLILWGRIVGPNSTKSTDILKHLQKWSDMESKIAVEGVHLTTLNFCTVSLKEGESLFCETPAQAPNGVDINSQNESTSPVTYIIVGMVALMLMSIFAIVVCLATVSFYKKKKVRDRQMRFHSSHPLDTIHNSAIPSSSAAKFKGEDDSNVYDQTDSIYETIMDDISPYSELQLQAPLSSESHMHTTQPPMEKQKRSSKSDDYSKYFSVEDHSQCCASQVPYDIIKPDTTFTPDYDTVSVDECKPSELECLDDYVPMFHEEDSMEADKSISFYQNLLCESSDANNVYQVPRPYIKMNTESANKDQDKRLSDCSDCGNTRGDVGATGENKMEPKYSGDM